MRAGSMYLVQRWIPACAGTTIKRMLGCSFLLLTVTLAALPAIADELGEAIGALGGSSFADKEKAIAALGKLGDPRAVPVLKGLAEDRLRRAPDGRIVLVETTGGTAKLTDAATGEPLKDLAPDGLDRIIVNNRLRGAIESALGGLTMFSPDPSIRLAAAQELLKRPSADAAAPLEKALAAEQDPEVRAAMQRGLAAVRLFAGSTE